jgi:hypothetical protein
MFYQDARLWHLDQIDLGMLNLLLVLVRRLDTVIRLLTAFIRLASA